jgi:hypothetical protein
MAWMMGHWQVGEDGWERIFADYRGNVRAIGVD